MNTKLLMRLSSLFVGLAGIFALFAPDILLRLLHASAVHTLLVLVQLIGALYFSFALMNWAAKDSIIGGIYARPVSLGNFSHFLTGTILLLKYQLSNEFNLLIVSALIVYAIFAFLFYWLVFRATGIVVDRSI